MSRFSIVLTVAMSLPMAAWANGSTVRSFSHTVTHEAARVEPPTGDKSYRSIRCWQASASPVYVGGKDVTPRNGYAICTNTPDRDSLRRPDSAAACQTDVISLEVSDLYAVVSRPQGPEAPGQQMLSCIVVQ